MPSYQQLLSYALACLGSGEQAEALKQAQAALEEARRVDPGGAREGEVQGVLALIHAQAGRAEEAAACAAAQSAIAAKFEDA